MGSGTVVGRVTLQDRATLAPGEEAVVRVRLEAPIVAVHGDRFVVRRYSPTTTIGGGVVLNATPSLRRRGHATLTQVSPAGGPEALVIAAAAAAGPSGLPAGSIAAAAGVQAAAAADAVAAALGRGDLVQRGERLFAREVVEAVRRRITETLTAHHARVPWRLGIPREDLKSRAAAGPDDRLFDEVLAELVGSQAIAERRALLALSSFEPSADEAARRIRTEVLATVEHAGASPPAADELRRLAPPELVDRALQGLADDGLIVAVTPELRFATSVLERIRAEVVGRLRAGEEVTVATLRDHLKTSRRYALALLEYFDRIRVTRRVGDRRALGPQADAPLPPPR
jgi:selenocysteine-specific elongation factor